MSNSIDYGNKMHRAMRGLIAEVLTEVAQDGLPGEHHFYITFNPTHPDVEMADWLFDRHPTEMTIVMQNWFDDLVIGEDGFRVTLNFGDSPETLSIPFDAILTFVDPSVEFGLRFELQDDDDDDELPELPSFEKDDAPAASTESPQTEDESQREGEAEVVSLDSFRKT